MQFISQNPKAKMQLGLPGWLKPGPPSQAFSLVMWSCVSASFCSLTSTHSPYLPTFFASSCTWKKITALQIECLPVLAQKWLSTLYTNSQQRDLNWASMAASIAVMGSGVVSNGIDWVARAHHGGRTRGFLENRLYTIALSKMSTTTSRTAEHLPNEWMMNDMRTRVLLEALDMFDFYVLGKPYFYVLNWIFQLKSLKLDAPEASLRVQGSGRTYQNSFAFIWSTHQNSA